jgi:hypothetical protein
MLLSMTARIGCSFPLCNDTCLAPSHFLRERPTFAKGAPALTGFVYSHVYPIAAKSKKVAFRSGQKRERERCPPKAGVVSSNLAGSAS